MTTQLVFREDAYFRDCSAKIVAINDRGGIVLDRTVFYPTGGGQTGDSGVLVLDTGGEVEIVTTVFGDDRSQIVHVPAPDQTMPELGSMVTATLDWPRRHRIMRMHTCLHLLSTVLDYPVTGGQITDGRGRLDFDIPDGGLDKQEITQALNRLIEADHPLSQRWITDAELDAKPELVKTMSVQPPRGSGKIRLIEIEGCDLQPCGGTHVARTGEIGAVIVNKIEKKGARNRRVRVSFV
ncbi:MAG: alanyl-tRNA editing protein [Alphaproteobacteria bacterium]